MAHRRWFSWLLALGLLVLPVSAFAASGAESVLKDKQSELITQLKKGKSPATDKKIDEIFDSFIDYGDLAKESLGPYWDERSDAEKKEFSEVLKKLVRNAYRANLKKTLKYEVEYKGEDQAKKGVLVKTVAKNKSNSREEPISIDYAMHEQSGSWTVYDTVTEGTSLVSSYRSQFTRTIKKQGFDALLKKMKKKAGV